MVLGYIETDRSFQIIYFISSIKHLKTINKPMNTGHNETKRKHLTKLKPTDGLV